MVSTYNLFIMYILSFTYTITFIKVFLTREPREKNVQTREYRACQKQIL